MIVCGKCGLNQCSGGSNCNMCDEAHEIMLSIQYPYRYLLLVKLYYKIIDPITLRASNTKYYIKEGWKNYGNGRSKKINNSCANHKVQNLCI